MLCRIIHDKTKTKMDLSIIILVIALMAIVISPFLLHYMSQKKKEAGILNEFMNFTKRENATISQKELWRQNYVIGIDEQSKKLYYYKKYKDKEERVSIFLSEVDHCRIDAVSRNARTKGGSITGVEKLDLVFTFTKPDKNEKTLQFYDSSEFLGLDNERVIIEKWFAIIKSNLMS